jgi:N-hydroxyarylamine O-acetyltransferase
MDTDRYLARIGYEGPLTTDRETLEALMRAHLSTVPFENLDVFNGIEVATDTGWSLAKILDRGRGGWCFELNGAFGLLLETLGFEVARLGAAVLLGGPSTFINHLALEVRLDRPYLVDVGFGDSFCRPLAMNRCGGQDGGTGEFELVPSPQGTTLTRSMDGVPAAQYRFKRVTLAMADFDDASRQLQATPNPTWHSQAFATRYLDGGPDRVTLIGNKLKVERGAAVDNRIVPDDQWSDTLEKWFGFRVELASAPDRRADSSAERP